MEFDQWKTTCPGCGEDGSLFVIRVNVPSINQTIYIHSELEKDGFAFDTAGHIRDASTGDEVVQCDNCFTVFDLSDLMIHIGNPYTVIGIHMDSEQPFTEIFHANSPTAAAQKAFDKVDNPDFAIVDILDGNAKICLNTAYLVYRDTELE